MVNVLVISELFWPEGSGGELATYLYLKKIDDVNFTILTGTPYDRIPSDIINKNNIEIINVPWLRRKHRICLWLELARNKDFLKKVISKHDVVYITREALPIAKYANEIDKSIKTVYHLHGYMPLSYNSVVIAPYEQTFKKTFKYSTYIAFKSGFIYGFTAATLGKPITWYTRKLLEYIDIIVCVSKRHREIILMSMPNIKDRTIHIYNPIPDDMLIKKKELNDTPTYIYVGGESIIKGFAQLLFALQYIISHKDIDFKIFLAGKYSGKTIKVIKKLKHAEKIKIFGKVTREKMKELYRKSWALIFPSISEEPLPYAVMEAIVAKIIPLASRVGGVPELVRNDMAKKLLFNPHSTSELIGKILLVSKLDINKVENISDKLKKHLQNKVNTQESVKKLISLFL